MKPIPGTKYYYSDGYDIYRKYKGGRMRPLKEGKNRVFTLTVDYNRIHGTRAKLVWCAEHGVSPTDIDAKFAFEMKDGVSECVMFADKMSIRNVQRANSVKCGVADYDYIIEFCNLVKAHMQGDEKASHRLWQILNKDRSLYVSYAMKYFVGKDKAEELADGAIMRVFLQAVKGLRAIPSPVASIKSEIRKKAIASYKRRGVMLKMEKFAI